MSKLQNAYMQSVFRVRQAVLTPRTRNIAIMVVVVLGAAVCAGLVIGGCNPFPTPAPVTPTATNTPTVFPTPTLTATFTATATATNTPTALPTFTPTVPPTETDMPTVTSIPTIIPGRDLTPIVGTATPTATQPPLPNSGASRDDIQRWTHLGGK